MEPEKTIITVVVGRKLSFAEKESLIAALRKAATGHAADSGLFVSEWTPPDNRSGSR